MRNIKEDYFEYLKDAVSLSNAGYDILLRELHGRKFEWEWDLPLDEDRALDGISMRDHYISDNHLGSAERNQLDGPCTVLEMLVAISGIMDNDTFDYENFEDRTGEFFKELISNIDLLRFEDATFSGSEDIVDIHERLDIWMYRQFDYDGTGSIFPLRNPLSDQRKNLIWYQKEAYLEENYPD